jgi:hypothetical protein
MERCQDGSEGARVCWRRRAGARHPAAVFAQADVAHAVGAIFDALPVADDGLQKTRIIELSAGAAADVAAHFAHLGLHAAPARVEHDGGAFDGGEAPAAAQADFFGAKRGRG